MPSRLEDYAFLSDLESAALVGKDGSIDWLTFPRFDSAACFSALLGRPEDGRWRIAPTGGVRRTTRQYRNHSLVLETVFETETGEVALIDCMPPRDDHLEVIRIAEGRRGRVEMDVELVIRFDYGFILPWVRSIDGDLVAVGGPDALRLQSPVHLEGHDLKSTGRFTVEEGQRVPFRLLWSPAHGGHRQHGDVFEVVEAAERWWRDWSQQCTYRGEWEDDVRRSLVVLKGLQYAPTGALAAAATTSLPEQIGGPRNWDYRFCWLRDATFSLMALLCSGFEEEALSFRDWLLRAVAGDPSKLQIMYGLAGERRLPELELDWLQGYEGSRPVRIGNGACTQFQLDVYGEIMDAAWQAQQSGIPFGEQAEQLEDLLLDFLEDGWRLEDEGIWEIRAGRQHFTHSKVMAWVAFDRGIKIMEATGRDADVARWKQAREEVKRWVLDRCVDGRGRLVQHPGVEEMDASLLIVPLVGFLPPEDERVIATVEGIEEELTQDGFVRRYRNRRELDGLPEGEGTFLLCSFWMAQAKCLLGRPDEARQLYERLLALRNDVGLLSEQYDPSLGRLLGNIPQAFSHTALINTAITLTGAGGRANGSAAARDRRPSR